MRIRMPRGHLELNLAGSTYLPDEEGAFDVPDHHGVNLIDVHGAERAPLQADFDAEAEAIALRIAQTKQALVLLEDDLKAAYSRAEAAKSRTKKTADAKAATEKQAAEKAAVEKAAAEKAAAEKAAAAGGKGAG